MIRIIEDKYFILTTPGSAYAFRVNDAGHLEHLHYGAGCGWTDETEDTAIAADCEAMAARRAFPPGNAVSYSEEFPLEIPEDFCYEVSSRGKGDLRDPFVSIRFADGSSTLDWKFASAEISKGIKAELAELPSSYAEEGKADTLRVTLKDAHSELWLILMYCVFRELDVITRNAKLVNGCTENVRVQRLMSSMLDFADDGYILTSFHGAWAREMDKESIPVQHTRVVNSTAAGASSNRSNPFVMLSKADTTETAGPCYGLNLVWSGNHYASAEVNAYGKTRFLSGMSPEDFEYLLKPGEELQAPEAVMAFSDKGFSGISSVMHPFVREHIVRGVWKNRPRPVLLNSWEAAYFDINESRLLKLAKSAANAGIELVVLDDGWFTGEDRAVDTAKFPHGLEAVSRIVHDAGLRFGLWYNIGTGYGLRRPEKKFLCRNEDGSVKYGGGYPAFCFGSAYRQGIAAELRELAERYAVDYFKLDFSAISSPYGTLPWGCHAHDHAFHRDFSDSIGAMYGGLHFISAELKNAFPKLVTDFSFEVFGPDRPTFAALRACPVHHVSNLSGNHPEFQSPLQIRRTFGRWFPGYPAERILGGLVTLHEATAEESFLTALAGAPLIAGDLRKLSPATRAKLADYAAQFDTAAARGPEMDFELLADKPDFDAFRRIGPSGHGFVCAFNRGDRARRIAGAAVPPGKCVMRLS